VGQHVREGNRGCECAGGKPRNPARLIHCRVTPRLLPCASQVEFDVTNGEKGPQASNVRDEAGNAFDRAPPPREGGFAPRDGGFTPREPREGGFRSDRAPRGDRDGGDRRPRRERAPRDEDM